MRRPRSTATGDDVPQRARDELYFSKRLGEPFDRVLEQTRAALQAEGFGVITEIDVADVFQHKLGVDFRPYRILGACNQAHAALSLNDSVGLLLPCNVVVQDVGDGATEVRAIDPVANMMLIGDPVLVAPAEAVSARLEAALDRL